MNAAVASIFATRLIGIVRLKIYSHSVRIARALLEGGLPVLEFSLSGEGALEAIAAVRHALGDEVQVGAGTVLSPGSVASAAAAGARFIVTPVMDREVIAACQRHNLPVVCGAFTPTEMVAAVQAGAELVKLFPARLGGPQYVRDLLAPLPDLRLVPTGGVSAENAGEYLRAGAVAVAIGGSLVAPELVAQGDFAQITQRARICVQAVQPG